MDRIDSIGRILEDLARSLDEPDLDPDAARADWPSQAARVAQVRALVNDRLFLDYAATLDEDEARGQPATNVRDATASTLGELVALCAAAGQTDAAKGLLDVASRLAPKSGLVRDELDAARANLDGYTALVRARWLLRAKREGEADKLLASLLKRTTDPKLRARVRETLDGPRALHGSVPPLFRVNGFGVGLYGERDRWPDGSYVTTLCVSALFIPIFPLRAYRVRTEERGWLFLARHRLSTFARGVQALVLGGALLGAGAGAYSSWSSSPEHLASVAFESAQADERAHHDDQALTRYESLLRGQASRLSDAQRAQAADAFARISLRAVREPLSTDDVDHAERVVRRYSALSSEAQTDGASTAFATAIARWMTQVGEASPAALQSSLRLAELGAQVAPRNRREPFEARRVAVHTQLAARYGAAWPLEAMPHLVAIGPAGARDALPLVEAVLASPSLTLAGESELAAWQRVAVADRDAALVARSTEVDLRVAAAHELANTEVRRQALETGDRGALEAWARAHADDQEVVAAIALQQRREGATPEAMSRLTALGSPGRMTPPVRLAYAELLADTGRVADADAVLTRTLETRLSRFQTAQRVWAATLERVEQRLVEEARAGGLPSDVQARMRDKAEAEQRQIFGEWLRGQMREAPELRTPREAMERVADVVPTALTLGMLKLRRANEFDGDERRRALGEAERLFLAIRDQAEGTPAFRLGLGQVYHRLGRAAEGDRELNALVTEGNAQQKLSVASVYRELGVTDRARAIAQGVYDGGEGESRGNAAVFMALLAESPEDEEMWLRRAPADQPSVRLRLRETEARRLLRDGRLAEADRAFAEAAEAYGRDASHDGAAANNAAVAEFSRFQCTGDVTRIDAGVRSLEQARRHEPESSIVASNLADGMLYRGQLRVLETFARASVLRPAMGDVSRILSMISMGPEREALLTAVRRDPSIQAGLELLRQATVLSPERVDLYGQESDVLDLLDDVEALRRLQGRLQRVERLDTSAQAAWLRRWLDGSDDARMRRYADASITQAARVVTEAEAAHHAPTLAVALALHGGALSSRARISLDPADERSAVALYRRAASVWNGVNIAQPLAGALLQTAVLTSREGDATLRAAFEADRRAYPTDQFLLRLRDSGAAGVASLAALRTQPGVDEALTLLREDAARMPQSTGLIVGRAFADDALTTASRPVIQRELARLSIAIDSIVRPTPATRERLALLR